MNSYAGNNISSGMSKSLDELLTPSNVMSDCERGAGGVTSGGSIFVLTTFLMLLATAAVTSREDGIPTRMTTTILRSADPAESDYLKKILRLAWKSQLNPSYKLARSWSK